MGIDGMERHRHINSQIQILQQKASSERRFGRGPYERKAKLSVTPNDRSRGEIPKILKLAWGKAFVEVVAMWRLACV